MDTLKAEIKALEAALEKVTNERDYARKIARRLAKRSEAQTKLLEVADSRIKLLRRELAGAAQAPTGVQWLFEEVTADQLSDLGVGGWRLHTLEFVPGDELRAKVAMQRTNRARRPDPQGVEYTGAAAAPVKLEIVQEGPADVAQVLPAAQVEERASDEPSAPIRAAELEPRVLAVLRALKAGQKLRDQWGVSRAMLRGLVEYQGKRRWDRVALTSAGRAVLEQVDDQAA